MVDAGAKVVAAALNGLQGVGNGGEEFGRIGRAAVGEHSLGELPDALIRVQLGGVAGKANQVKAPDTLREVTNEPPCMRRPAVPEEIDVAAQVPQKISQEITGLLLPDVLEVELKV